MQKKAIIVICTRPESSRVPEKCFRKIGGKTAIDHILERVIPSRLPVILAVPTGRAKEYKARITLANHRNVYFYEGNPESPLHRMADAIQFWAQNHSTPDYVIRITHDDIIIDSKTMTDLLQRATEAGAGYGVSPRIIQGAGVEVMSTENVLHAAKTWAEPVEHISYYVRGPNVPNPVEVSIDPRSSIRRPGYRLTLDYPEDIAVLETVFRNLGQSPSVDSICEYVDLNTYVLNHNRLPEFTVYTCARNAERFIHQTILNVLQLPHDIEYVIVDDASTDGTLNEIMRFTAVNRDPRLKVIVNEENLGLSSSCNRVLDRARGRYIIRVDADDLLYSHALDVMRRAMDSENVAVCYSGYHEMNEQGKVSSDIIAGEVNHHAGCALMDTRLLRQIKFTEGLKHWDGLDLYNRIKNKFQIVYEKSPLWLYRQVGTSLSHQDTPERRAAKKEIAQ